MKGRVIIGSRNVILENSNLTKDEIDTLLKIISKFNPKTGLALCDLLEKFIRNTSAGNADYELGKRDAFAELRKLFIFILVGGDEDDES